MEVVGATPSREWLGVAEPSRDGKKDYSHGSKWKVRLAPAAFNSQSFLVHYRALGGENYEGCTPGTILYKVESPQEDSQGFSSKEIDP